MSERRFKDNLAIFSWALYDFANTFFAMNIVSLYFALWVTVDKGGKDIFYSLAIASSMLFMILFLPTLGIASDRLGKRIPFLVYSTLLCIIFTGLLGIAESLLLGLILFSIANFSYQLATVFYNALLIQISPSDEIGLTEPELNNFFILSSTFAIFGSILSGFISDRFAITSLLSFIILGYLFLRKIPDSL